MLGGADNPNGELPSYITGADSHPCQQEGVSSRNGKNRTLSRSPVFTSPGKGGSLLMVTPSSLPYVAIPGPLTVQHEYVRLSKP